MIEGNPSTGQVAWGKNEGEQQNNVKTQHRDTVMSWWDEGEHWSNVDTQYRDMKISGRKESNPQINVNTQYRDTIIQIWVWHWVQRFDNKRMRSTKRCDNLRKKWKWQSDESWCSTQRYDNPM